jgi:asparagine synthase (glutamine-hydrolysing)
MCGIAGILFREAQRPVDRALLAGMGLSIAHRGPDAEGVWSEPGVGLVHRRLSIIDLAGGNQPIGNEDGSVQVVFNGEIYNYRELRKELEARGHRFATSSDTEVLVHLYEERGEDLVKPLRGMFAFALWDRRQRRLLLARDRVGQKPLFVYRDGEKLLFASELKGILAHPEVDRGIDAEGLEDYLAFGFIPGERSIFRRVRKLPPGHVLSVTADTLDARPRAYWSWESQWATSRGGDEAAAAEPAAEARSAEAWQEIVRERIAESVKLHTVADVPIGAFLSGGLDSSVIVSHLAELSSQPVRTFSIGFNETGYSELPYAREVARRFGCEHTEEIVTPEAASSLHDLVHYYDEPFADPSALPTMWLSRLARRSVKVALSGDGGDEAFGGYARYAHDLWEAGLRSRLPGWLRRGALGPLSRAWPKADWLPRPLRAKTLLTNLSLNAAEAYANTLTLCRNPARRRLLSGDVRSELNGHRPERLMQEAYRSAVAGEPLAGMIAADIAYLLPDDFLAKVDRASMSCGLEVRPPLVDHELLKLSAQIPAEYKIRSGETKWILKQAYSGRLPHDVVWRKKHGFDLPIDEWLRGPLREAIESTVLGNHSRVSDLIDRGAARRLYQAHLNKTGRHGAVLWSLLVLGHWTEQYLKGCSTSRCGEFVHSFVGN